MKFKPNWGWRAHSTPRGLHCQSGIDVWEQIFLTAFAKIILAISCASFAIVAYIHGRKWTEKKAEEGDTR